jgi:monofunctional chorismate mutase
MDLEHCRQEIDELDRELVRYMERRMNVVAQVAQYKQLHNMPVYDHRRELMVLDKVAGLVQDKELVPYVQRIFQNMMDESKRYERIRMER